MASSSISWRHPRQLALTAAALAAVIIAAGALLWNARSGSSEQPPVSAAPTPTPGLLSGVPADPVGALSRLQQEAPAAASALDGLLRGDPAATLSRLRTLSVACETIMVRGETDCTRLGVAPGTVIRKVTLDRRPNGFWADEADARRAVEYLLAGPVPRLDLLATMADGTTLAILGIEPRDPFDVPGGPVQASRPENRVARLQVHIAPDGTILGIAQATFSTPPLEVIRYDEHNGIGRYTIRYASPELRQQEADFAAGLADASRP